MNAEQKKRYRMMGAGALVNEFEALEDLCRRQSRAADVVLHKLVNGEHVPAAFIGDLERASAEVTLKVGF